MFVDDVLEKRLAADGTWRWSVPLDVLQALPEIPQRVAVYREELKNDGECTLSHSTREGVVPSLEPAFYRGIFLGQIYIIVVQRRRRSGVRQRAWIYRPMVRVRARSAAAVPQCSEGE